MPERLDDQITAGVTTVAGRDAADAVATYLTSEWDLFVSSAPSRFMTEPAERRMAVLLRHRTERDSGLRLGNRASGDAGRSAGYLGDILRAYDQHVELRLSEVDVELDESSLAWCRQWLADRVAAYARTLTEFSVSSDVGTSALAALVATHVAKVAELLPDALAPSDETSAALRALRRQRDMDVRLGWGRSIWLIGTECVMPSRTTTPPSTTL